MMLLMIEGWAVPNLFYSRWDFGSAQFRGSHNHSSNTRIWLTRAKPKEMDSFTTGTSRKRQKKSHMEALALQRRPPPLHCKWLVLSSGHVSPHYRDAMVTVANSIYFNFCFLHCVLFLKEKEFKSTAVNKHTYCFSHRNHQACKEEHSRDDPEDLHFFYRGTRGMLWGFRKPLSILKLLLEAKACLHWHSELIIQYSYISSIWHFYFLFLKTLKILFIFPSVWSFLSLKASYSFGVFLILKVLETSLQCFTDLKFCPSYQSKKEL